MAEGVAEVVDNSPGLLETAAGKTTRFLKGAKVVVDKYFLKPNDDTGIGSLRLDVIGEQTLTMSSEVTNNYTESNTSYQDQISLKPLVYTITGEVGELVYYKKEGLDSVLDTMAGGLGFVTSFVPSLSKTASKIMNIANKAAQLIEKVDSYLTLFDKMTATENNQQRAYLMLLALHYYRAPIDVTTPWTDLRNFRITNVTLTQPKETKDKSLISITLQEFRTTDLTPVPFDPAKYQSRTQDQKAPNVEQGQTQGVPTSTLRNVKDNLLGGNKK